MESREALRVTSLEAILLVRMPEGTMNLYRAALSSVQDKKNIPDILDAMERLAPGMGIVFTDVQRTDLEVIFQKNGTQ